MGLSYGCDNSDVCFVLPTGQTLIAFPNSKHRKSTPVEKTLTLILKQLNDLQAGWNKFLSNVDPSINMVLIGVSVIFFA